MSEEAQSPIVPQAQNAQSLLEGIFGGASDGGAAAQGAPPQTRQQAVNDILGLFDSTPSAPAAAPAAAQGGLSGLAFGGAASPPTAPAPAAAPAPAPAPAPTPAAQPSYTAYDKTGLKIVFSPQVSAAHPGMVAIIARFAATSGETVTGLNFQAAVPKVRTQPPPLLPNTNR